MGAQPRQRAGLVLAHQTAVAGDIGGENGRKPALHSLTLHQVVDPEGALATKSRIKLAMTRASARNGGFGAKPEAADLNMSFRSAPKAANSMAKERAT